MGYKINKDELLPNNHINNIAKEPWFKEKPWLILGTGLSLSDYKDEYKDKFNIWAIYVSIDVSKYADVFHYQDIYCNYYGDEWVEYPYRYCATRYAVAKHFIPPKSVNIVYDRDETGITPNYPLSNSTSFAFLFLTQNGIKDIYSLGIADGQNGICPLVNKQYIEESLNNNWGVENGANQHWCDVHGAKWTKL